MHGMNQRCESTSMSMILSNDLYCNIERLFWNELIGCDDFALYKLVLTLFDIIKNQGRRSTVRARGGGEFWRKALA